MDEGATDVPRGPLASSLEAKYLSRKILATFSRICWATFRDAPMTTIRVVYAKI
jgi:hypothetical protein